jgi:hypothetical protein
LDSVNLINESNERFEEADYFNGERVILNTLSFADLFTSARIDKSINYPEVALMFIKTYMYRIFKDKSTIGVPPNMLYKIMNNNQELIELPYVMVLYLGALYHYKIYNSGANINTQSLDTVFNRTNKVALANQDEMDPKNNLSRDIYQTQELFRSPGRIRIEHNTKPFNRKVYFPSVRVLNRSVLTGSTIFNTNNIEFKYMSGKDTEGQEIISNGSVDSINIMPAIGYGIQNNFLNYYNQFIFGDYMNGSVTLDINDNVYNDGLPHVLIGGYCGITKPIKTYDSGLLEFTALYRNAWVGGFSINDIGYRIDDLVNGFNDALQNFKLTNDYDANKQSLIRSFIILSRIKALFLSDQITTENTLYTYISKLTQRKTLGSGPDLYYLMVNYFFANEDEIIEKLINPSTQAIEDESDPTAMIAGYITQYLFGIWGREKFNLQPKFNNINSKAVYGLYPSAGGFISPHALFNDPNKKTKLNLATDNGTTKIGSSETDFFNSKNLFTSEVVPNNNYYRPVFNSIYYFNENENKVDMYSIKSSEIYNLIKPYEITTEQTDPRKPQYFFNKDFNNDGFLLDYCFKNHSILRNTTRFFWFDTTNNGRLLKCDLTTGKTINFYEDLVSGVDKMINDRTYFTHNHFFNYDYQTYNDYFIGTGATWGEQFTLAHLMDSLDFEKLEEFRQLFLNFATPDSTLPGNEGFNVKTLMLASTIIGYDDIESYTDDLTTTTLTPDDINIALIGNSMYNYNFIAKSGLNKFINGALTKAQKKKVSESIGSFCSQTTTIANFSPMGSIKYNTAPELSAHLFPFSPDIIFSDVKNYDELITKLKPTPYNISEEDITRYLSRKILFGDTYVPSHNVKNTTTELNDLNALNSLYLINRMYTQKTDATKDDPGHSLDVKDLYKTIVYNYFKELNIDFDRNIYKQQIKMIRSYVFDTLKQLKLINEELMPNNKFMSYNDFNTYFKITPPKPITNAVADDTTPSAYISRSGFDLRSAEGRKLAAENGDFGANE